MVDRAPVANSSRGPVPAKPPDVLFPGWQDDPSQPGFERFWNGRAWTQARAKEVAPPSTQPTPDPGPTRAQAEPVSGGTQRSPLFPTSTNAAPLPVGVPRSQAIGHEANASPSPRSLWDHTRELPRQNVPAGRVTPVRRHRRARVRALFGGLLLVGLAAGVGAFAGFRYASISSTTPDPGSTTPDPVAQVEVDELRANLADQTDRIDLLVGRVDATELERVAEEWLTTVAEACRTGEQPGFEDDFELVGSPADLQAAFAACDPAN